MIKKHKSSTIFWPDLAAIHFGKSVLKWYEENDVRIVGKNINPPNCPELRPIEIYWTRIKTILRKSGRTARSVDDLRKDWL